MSASAPTSSGWRAIPRSPRARSWRCTAPAAAPADARDAAQLLHDFNTEFGDETPGPEALAERLAQLLAEGHTAVLLAGARPDGVAVLRFRPSIWTTGLECYLAELYVAPAL